MNYQKILNAILPSNKVDEEHVVYWLYSDEDRYPHLDGYIGVTSARRFERRMKEHHKSKDFKHIRILIKGFAEECYLYEYTMRPLPHIGMNKATGGAKGRDLNYSHSEETKNKIGKANKGNKRPDLSERNRKGGKQPITKCPYCGKEGGRSNMTRYHFDNCNEIK